MSFLAGLFTDEVIGILGTVVGTALLFLFRAIWKDQAERKEAMFKLGVEIAYSIVNEIAKRTQTKVDDKVALGLDALRQYLATQGQKLTPADEDRARLTFQAMHGQELASK